MTIYTGDILITELDDGQFDIKFANGQLLMTNGLETMSLLAVFGEDWWGNGIVRTESEKMKSEVPGIIRRNVVSDKTKNDVTKAIEKTQKFMIRDKIAKSVKVTGEIFSAFGIQWLIEIASLDDDKLRYFLNWDRGSLTASIIA